jgi:hypothetical protein
MQSRRIWPAQSPIFASGGSSTVSFQDLPAGRIEALLLRIKTDIVQGASATAITGSMLASTVALARIRDYLRMTGRGLSYLRWIMQGYQPNTPQDIPAAAATYSRFVDIWIPFADFYQSNPLDTALDTQILSDQPLELNFGNVAALYGANTSFANTSIRVLAFLDKPSPGDIPSEQYINFADWNQQSILLPVPGAITHAFAYNETSDSMTDANFATFTVYADGDIIKPVLQTGELAAEFDQLRAAGVGVLNTSTGTGGELIVDEPGTGAAAGQGLTVPFIPIVSQPDRYSLTHVPFVDNTLRIDYTGAATAIRLVTRQIKVSGSDRAYELGRKIGLDNVNGRKVGLKVQGPGVVDANKASILPKKLTLNANEVRARGGTA